MESQVIQFLSLAWKNATENVPFSYERINHTMQRVLFAAVGSFKFELDDWKKINEGFRSGYWLDTERYYTAAIGNDNASAVASIEKHLGRTPLIADNVRVASVWSDVNTHGSPGERKKERLHVGAKFKWKGHRVTVTSMGTDSCVACSYVVTNERDECDACGHVTNWPREKVGRRFTITREDIMQDRAERKRRDEIWSRLVVLEAGSDVKRLIGSTNRDDFDKLPLKKLEKMLAQIEKLKEGEK